MRLCCAHMRSGMEGNKNRLKYSDDDLIASASRYKHKSDWKAADLRRYSMCSLRPEVFARATAHMTPKAHPYSGTYIVYVYEFTDHHVYVGLTFRPEIRHALHMQRGSVRDHMRVCPDYTYKIVEKGIASPDLVGDVERRWIGHYVTGGWILLNKASGGGLGTVQVTKWTKEAVMAQALKYKTRQEWIDNSQMSYRIAKREGWYEEASAHMPTRVLGIGTGREVSQSTRDKQRQAKLGKAQSPEWRAARIKAIQDTYDKRRKMKEAAEAVGRGLSAD